MGYVGYAEVKKTFQQTLKERLQIVCGLEFKNYSGSTKGSSEHMARVEGNDKFWKIWRVHESCLKHHDFGLKKFNDGWYLKQYR